MDSVRGPSDMPAKNSEHTSGLFDVLDEGWLRGKPGTKWHRVGPDVLPAWVADMDYPDLAHFP